MITGQASTTTRAGKGAEDEGTGIDDLPIMDAKDGEVMGAKLEYASYENGVKVAEGVDVIMMGCIVIERDGVT